MSDNSYSPPAGDPNGNVPPAPPAPPVQGRPAAPPAPPAPSYAPPAPAPTQAYPGAAPSYVPPAAPAYGNHSPAPGYTANHSGASASYGTPSYPVARPTSGLAITSLVCAIASVVFSWLVFPILAAVAAVITGHMALKQTRANAAIGGRGVAFAGLIIGYVMLGFLALGIIVTIISFVFFGAFTIPFLLNT